MITMRSGPQPKLKALGTKASHEGTKSVSCGRVHGIEVSSRKGMPCAPTHAEEDDVARDDEEGQGDVETAQCLIVPCMTATDVSEEFCSSCEPTAGLTVDQDTDQRVEEKRREGDD